MSGSSHKITLTRLLDKIKGGWLDFDKAIATPDMMPKVGPIAKISAGTPVELTVALQYCVPRCVPEESTSMSSMIR